MDPHFIPLPLSGYDNTFRKGFSEKEVDAHVFKFVLQNYRTSIQNQ